MNNDAVCDNDEHVVAILQHYGWLNILGTEAARSTLIQQKLNRCPECTRRESEVQVTIPTTEVAGHQL